MGADEVTSSYLDHLPATFRLDPFIGQFLRAFERILTGKYDGADLTEVPADPDQPDAPRMPLAPGIEALLDRVHRYFDPGPGSTGARAPDDFLPWLAGWVATSLRDDWDTETRRRFIQRVPSLYRMRGTPECLATMLRIYLDKDNPRDRDDVRVDDSSSEPYYFKVQFTVAGSPEHLDQTDRIARAIIDQEKPAHTYYGLIIDYPQLQILNEGATDPNHEKGVWVGNNTVLGTVVFRRP